MRVRQTSDVFVAFVLVFAFTSLSVIAQPAVCPCRQVSIDNCAIPLPDIPYRCRTYTCSALECVDESIATGMCDILSGMFPIASVSGSSVDCSLRDFQVAQPRWAGDSLTAVEINLIGNGVDASEVNGQPTNSVLISNMQALLQALLPPGSQIIVYYADSTNANDGRRRLLQQNVFGTRVRVYCETRDICNALAALFSGGGPNTPGVIACDRAIDEATNGRGAYTGGTATIDPSRPTPGPSRSPPPPPPTASPPPPPPTASPPPPPPTASPPPPPTASPPPPLPTASPVPIASPTPAPLVCGETVFQVTNRGNAAYIFPPDFRDNPTRTLTRGCTYTFMLNAPGHPFVFKTAPNSPGLSNDLYANGVTGATTDVGNVTFAVPLDAPNPLYYQCTNHAAMSGRLDIIGGSSSTPTPNPSDAPYHLIPVSCTGNQEVPPVQSNAITQVLLGYQRVTRVIFGIPTPRCAVDIGVRLNAGNYSSPVISAHLHMPGPRGVNAPVIWTVISSPEEGAILNNRGTSIVKNSDLDVNVCDGIDNANVYFNLHTVNFPAGENRGQIIALNRFGLFVRSPGVAFSDGQGSAFVQFPDESTICIQAEFWGLTSALTNLHIHAPASVGNNAPVIIPLFDEVEVMYEGFYVIKNYCTAVTFANRQLILINLSYMNVHTANNLGGEIRAQLVPYNSQLVPPLPPPPPSS